MRRSRDSVGAPAVDPNNSSNNNNNNPIEFHPSSSPPAGALHISSSSSSVPLLFKSGGGASAGPATTGTLESIWDLYSVEGDARASLEALRTVLNTENAAAAGHQSPSSSLAVQYNSLWLSQLAASSGGETATTTTTPLHDASPESPGALLSKLQVLEASILQYHPPSVATVDSTTTSQSSSSLQRQGRYLQRNATILAYNRALLHWAQGDIPACVAICATTVTPLVDKSSTKQQQQQQQATSFNDTILCIASCRLAMLWLECILLVGKNGTMSADNSHATIAATTTDTSSTNHVVLSLPLLDAGSIVAWLEHSLANSSQSSSTNHITNTHSRNKNSPSSDAFSTEELKQLKFLLPVYKSRLFLAEFDDQGKRIEACIRSARKDMKTAMEVFQNKLRPAYINNLGEVSSAGSVTSLNNSEDGMNTSGLQQHSFPILERTSSSIPSVSGNIVLQKLNQSALVVKAHLEQLKGNTKKSLVLCSEAMSASDGAAFEPLRMNNLAVVYETNNRRYLALHALVKSLRAANPINGNNESSEGVGTTMSSFFQSDGTANPDLTPSILYNTAVCALRARNYVSAYECMAACLSASPIFANRPKCWLRLAEACLGIASNLKKDQETNQIAAPLFSAVVNVDRYVETEMLQNFRLNRELLVASGSFDLSFLQRYSWYCVERLSVSY